MYRTSNLSAFIYSSTKIELFHTAVLTILGLGFFEPFQDRERGFFEPFQDRERGHFCPQAITHDRHMLETSNLV